MRKRVPDEATCAICGRHFDPSETRGWCPNPSCGEWQHPAFPVEDDSKSTGSVPNSGTSAGSSDHPGAESDESDADSGALTDCPDCGADLSGIPSDRLSACPICMFDLTPFVDTDEHEGTAPDKQRAATDRSHPSESEATSTGGTPEREERATGQPASSSTDTSTASTPTDTPTTGTPTDTPTASTPTDTPTDRSEGAVEDSAEDPAEKPIDSVDGIAAGYVQRLHDAGIWTVGDLVANNPDELSARTGVSTRRIHEWINSVPLDPPASDRTHQSGQAYEGVNTGSAGGGTAGHESSTASSPGTGTTDDSSGSDIQETRIQRSTPELVLRVKGQTLPVSDGDIVGSEVRNAMVEAGVPQEEAVYVHRKHVQFVVESGEFMLTRLGENSLTVNGQPVDKGAQVRIQDGDQIEFSGVVTATASLR